MAYKVKQFRFYNDGSSVVGGENQPAFMPNGTSPVTKLEYINGEVFENYYPIVQFGVQALPGTRLRLNESVDPIIIGQTGIYELDLNNGVQITQVKVEAESMETIETNPNAFLLIDIIYDSMREEE